MKIIYWCDSGANVYSKRSGEITLEELGYTEEQWNAFSVYEKDEIMSDIACDRLDWGYSEII